MKLIAGLGNPGPRYAESRHNIGFRVADELARRWRISEGRYDRHFEAQVAEGQVAGERVLLLKPTTYMNLSGRAVGAAWRYYKLTHDALLVIYDDLDLAVGQLRVRSAGSAGGHKGMTDVIRQLGSDQIARVRIGIGKVHPSATTEFVLSRFEPDERPVIEAAVAQAADAATCWLTEGVAAAMNKFNRRREPPTRGDDRSEGDAS